MDMELSQRINWLIRLRWLASSAVIYGTFLFTGFLGVRLDPLPLYLIGAAIATYNSFLIVGLKWSEVASTANRLERARVMANAQIVIDLFFLTLLIHFSGGVENPIAFFYIFHVIIASILLSRRETFLQATIAVVLYGSLVLGEYARYIPHLNLFDWERSEPAFEGLFVAVTLLVFCSTLYLAAYMATSITARLRSREMEIMALTRALEEKAQELEGAYNQLSKLEQIKSQYMGRVSHEMKAPLSSVQSSLKAVLDGKPETISPTQRELVAKAEKRIRGLLSLAADLLILARTREAKMFTDRRPLSASAVVEKVVAQHSPRAEARGLSLETLLPGTPLTIFAEPEALEQMLSNLLSNAINYTPTGGKVELGVDSIENTVRFQVRDTGIGIPSADVPKVFNEFYRAENARRFCEEGTGLGLSIVRTIVDAHGGEINLESQVGVGTTVTVVLPRGEMPPDGEAIEGEERPEAAESDAPGLYGLESESRQPE